MVFVSCKTVRPEMNGSTEGFERASVRPEPFGSELKAELLTAEAAELLAQVPTATISLANADQCRAGINHRPQNYQPCLLYLIRQSLAQEYIHCAGATVAGLCCGESEHQLLQTTAFQPP
jgi:hypothetical protein